mmetsp:Transcript_10487/g.11412  ORF Transcript_10487/g.11412 Transcript_10487/m.11412 type:complete len:777 (+) Transcript_10487:82-2412(+)
MNRLNLRSMTKTRMQQNFSASVANSSLPSISAGKLSSTSFLFNSFSSASSFPCYSFGTRLRGGPKSFRKHANPELLRTAKSSGSLLPDDDPSLILNHLDEEFEAKSQRLRFGTLELPPQCTASTFAQMLNIPFKTLQMGLRDLDHPDKLNSSIDLDVAELLAMDYNVKVVQGTEQVNQLQNKHRGGRPPIITIMGHVDHGKTTLLDGFRDSDVCDSEFGGITQGIGAFSHKLSDGSAMTFIDTPGHEAFDKMRCRGSKITDIIVLVVSAVDGVQAQTIEAINHALAADVPIVVAINKIDKGSANPEAVEESLEAYGISLERFGGSIPSVHVSAKNKIGLDDLEQEIMIQSEMLDLSTNHNSPGEAVVIESRVQKGAGSVCSILVQKGTIKRNDIVISGTQYGRVKRLRTEGGVVNTLGPSEAAEVVGFKKAPAAGSLVYVVESETKARILIERRQKREEERALRVRTSPSSAVLQAGRFNPDRETYESSTDVESESEMLDRETFDMSSSSELDDSDPSDAEDSEVFSSDEDVTQLSNKSLISHNGVAALSMVEDDIPTIVLKASDYGMLEAISQKISKLCATRSAAVSIISQGIGSITDSEINLARDADAIIFGMGIDISRKTEKALIEASVTCKMHKIIYHLVDDLELLIDQAGPDGKFKVQERGDGIIGQVYEIKRKGGRIERIYGVVVENGILDKSALFRVVRKGEVIEEGLELDGLKRFKDSVEMVEAGNECGLQFKRKILFEKGDKLQCYQQEEKANLFSHDGTLRYAYEK